MSNNKGLIRDSLINILSTESFYDITVKRIIEVAGVSRSTFYNYYQDKHELMAEIQNELIDGFLAILQDISARGLNRVLEAVERKYYQFFEAFFVYVKKHHTYFRVLLKENNGINFRASFLMAINKEILKTLKAWNIYDLYANNPFSEYILQILTASIIVTFTKWLKSDMKINEYEMAGFFSQFWSGQFCKNWADYAAKHKFIIGNDILPIEK